jgi:hypothetical protein
MYSIKYISPLQGTLRREWKYWRKGVRDDYAAAPDRIYSSDFIFEIPRLIWTNTLKIATYCLVFPQIKVIPLHFSLIKKRFAAVHFGQLSAGP